jgi:hypothetical protein
MERTVIFLILTIDTVAFIYIASAATTCYHAF